MALVNVTVAPLHVGFNARGAALIPRCQYCPNDAEFIVTGEGAESGEHVSIHVCRAHHPAWLAEEAWKLAAATRRRLSYLSTGRYGD